MWRQCPWLVGALGPLTCDVITGFQMMIFGYSTAPFMENGGKECDDSSTSKHENDPQEVIPEL